MFQKLRVLLILSLFLTSTLSEAISVYARALHSIDDLPFGTLEDRGSLESLETSSHSDSARAALLDDLDRMTSISKEEIHAQKNPPKNITFSLTETTDIRLLLAEKRVFEKREEILTPGFITNPFTENLLSSNSLLSVFLSSGSGEDVSTGTMAALPTLMVEDPDMALAQEAGKTITTKTRVKQKNKIAGLPGSLTYQIPVGTVIRSASGDMIDTALIGTLPLPEVDRQKAKVKYEKKMKNRGTKKKGFTQAAVQGFEFGLSGSHLIFSSPVTLTIDTPNMSDGVVLDLMTMHAGDTDFHTGGLSVSQDTLCNTDGVASIPGSQVIVKGGKVTFYTCGASLFTMNPSGGTTGSNDLRLLIGDCAQIQLYYNNLTQIYTGNPPATGCNAALSAWPTLRIGATTYGNGFTAWTSATTTGSTIGNTYKATSTMRATVGGLNYDLIIDWSHTAPNKYFTWSWRVVVPPTNTNNVRFYYGMDSFVAGGDADDTGYFTNTGGQTVGIYDSVANVLSAFRYMSGTLWTGYEAGAYTNINTRISGGTDFNNTHVSSGDLGFGVNWNLGTVPATYSGTVEWRLLPYVAANVVDLIPGIAQPEGPLTTNLLSQIPITVTNAGNLTSSGIHTIVLTVPANITGPVSPFTDNGWSCGAQIGTGVTCTKTTSIIPPTGNDIVRIPVTPTSGASGTSVTFNASISNPGDSNLTNNTAFATNAVIGGPTIASPGGVGGVTLWLKGNTGTNCIATGCTITTWSNSGTLGVAANAVIGIGTVIYDPTTKINGNPSIYFNNASLSTNSTLNVTTAASSIFTMTRIASGGAFLLGTQSGTLSGVEWSTSPTLDKFGLFGGTAFYNGANIRNNNIPAITTSTRATGGASLNRTNGLQTLSSATPVTAFASSSIGIGRTNTVNSTLANVGEVIAYPTELTGAARNQVESYLAIKYGITLDQTTATNYTLSNGSVVWNATSAGLYKNNIAGIARDDTSALSQLQSQSVTATGDIIVSKASIGTNRMALMWAHDGAQASTFTGVDSPIGYQRISREWLMQEKNGDLGTVTISYPAPSIPGGFTAPLMMLVDGDGIFATGATAYTGTYSTGTNTWDFSANISDLDSITFARAVPTDTTPPTFLTTSVASGTLAPIGTFPLTYTYSDTGSAIVPSSFSGKIYSWNATGATWNVIDLAPVYLSVTSATTSTGVFALTSLPFGRYRFDISVADAVGNIATQSSTIYIDAIEWTLSAPTYAIGNAPLSTDTFGSGELILTVKTVGAGFDLTMLRTGDLAYSGQTITVYSGSAGWGYDKNILSGYSTTITPHSTSQTLVTTLKSINVNGQKNTFTYRLKYGVNPNANNPAGDYIGNMQFGINLTY